MTPRETALDDTPIYAVGDVHGRLDLLDLALAAIEAEAGDAPRRILFLGDYVDRGPHSRGVVERLMQLTADPESGVACLRGNHEATTAKVWRTGEPVTTARWLQYGGVQTLESYGWPGGEPDLSLIPADHIAWMEALPVIESAGGRTFVHAGVTPGATAGDQGEYDCLWIREPFLRAPAARLPGHVVHGHTPRWDGKPEMSQPELLPHRTNLDTGAYATGVLTVGVFEPGTSGGPSRLLSVRLPT